MNIKEKALKTIGKGMGFNVVNLDKTNFGGNEFFGSGEVDGTQFKGVYTDAFWLSPPYGRPRDIDYNRLEAIEDSAWVRMCIQHITDSVASAKWNIVPVAKGEEVGGNVLDEVKDFFSSKTWKESFKRGIKMAIPDVLQYDCGVMIKAFPLRSYGEDKTYKSKGEKPVQMYVRDGRSFLKDVDLYGVLKEFWQYSWINPHGIPIKFDPEEIIYMQQSPQSRNPYGISNLEIVEEIIQYMMDSTLAQSKYWKNGMFIGGQIDMPDVKDLNELKRYQAYYEAKLRGARKFGKWLITGGGATVKTIPFTPQQMQWVDSQKWFAKIVFGIFKVTPSELGFTEDLNRATGIQQQNIHKSKAIKPILEMVEDHLNREVVWKHFNEKVMFQYERELDLEDSGKQVDIDVKHIDSGLRSVNEVRDRDGLEKWDEKYDKPKDDQEGMMEEGGFEEREDEMDWSSLFEQSSLIDFSKKPIWIKDASQAPKGAKIIHGKKGGLYYEDGGQGKEKKQEEPKDGMSEVEEFSKGLVDLNDGELEKQSSDLIEKNLEIFKGWYGGGTFMFHLDSALTETFGMPEESARIIGKGSEPKEYDSKALVQSYLITQEILGRKYPDGKVTLYRGTDGRGYEQIKDKKVGESSFLEDYNVSSWTEQKETAEGYANRHDEAEEVGGAAFVSEIPIKQIFNITAHSGKEHGLGDQGLGEFIIMGAKREGKIHTKYDPYDVISEKEQEKRNIIFEEEAERDAKERSAYHRELREKREKENAK